MLALALLLAAGPGPARAPDAVIISTPRGETRLGVRVRPEGPVIPAAPLFAALRVDLTRTAPEWADVTVEGHRLRLLLNTPFVLIGDSVAGLGGSTVEREDSLFVPLGLVTHLLPGMAPGRFRWNPAEARLVVTGLPAPTATSDAPRPRRTHTVAIDPGHGGSATGTLGRYLPRGTVEKDIALAVGLLLREELERRDIKVRMTRTTDVNPTYRGRATTCTAECDLFVSLHVDALPQRPGYTEVQGFSTYIIGDENTADAQRVARMENDALRYEPEETAGDTSTLDFILRDLQMNEYLRESARAATLLQEHVERVHVGPNRGVKKFTNIAVLNLARRPAMLVEMGYSTNREDAAFMSSRAGQRKLARAMADAIEAYLRESEVRTASGDGTP